MAEEGERKSRVIELDSDLKKVLWNKYNQDRSIQPSFTAFVNSYLNGYIKKQRLLTMLYPHLSVILADRKKGFYIKDKKKEDVAEITITNLDDDDANLVECSIDKDKEMCEHIEYALQSFGIVQMFEMK